VPCPRPTVRGIFKGLKVSVDVLCGNETSEKGRTCEVAIARMNKFILLK
jgi:hypothetical protein